MNLAALPDDPTRTADYGYFFWERSTESQPVTEAEAFEAVCALLAGYTTEAFGEAREYWCEILNDHICEPSDFCIAFLSVLGRGGDAPSATRYMQQGIRKFIHEHACGLLEKS